MKLVIEIDDKYYTDIKESEHCGNYSVLYALDAIRNGKPLPKGHGDLKDADAMINKLCTHEASELFGSITCAEIMDFINDEKPIIEADKEGE